MFKSDGNCQGGSDPYNSESGMGTISYRFFAVFSAAVQLLPLLPVNSFHERNQHEQQDNSCEPYYYSENHLSQKHRQTHTGAEKERPGMCLTTAATVFLLSFTGALPSIRLQMMRSSSKRSSPAIPAAIPCPDIPHSGRSAVHMPRAKNMPPIVPRINAIKLLFFIFYPHFRFFRPVDYACVTFIPCSKFVFLT